MRQIIRHSESSKSRNYKVIYEEAKLNAMPSYSQQKKPKRFRSAFTTEQINFLEEQFQKFPYINREHRKEVATFLRMEERPIKIWFQNRRMKEKRESHKEFNDDVNRNQQEFLIGQLNNVSAMPSANDQRSYSLPILSLTADAVANVNIDGKKANKVEHKEKIITEPNNITGPFAKPKDLHRKANYYTEVINEEILSPYFHRQPTNNTTVPITIHNKNNRSQSQEHESKTSAEFSINLCKKYKEECAATDTTVNGNIVHEGQKIKQSEPRHPLKKDINCFSQPKVFSTSKKPKISIPPPPLPQNHVNLNSPAYYPVMSAVYAPPFMSTGGVLWKPVNFMPVMATSSPPVTVSHSQGPPAHNQDQNCKCNCHGSTQHIPMSLPPNLQNPYGQYVITVPYQHTSPKF